MGSRPPISVVIADDDAAMRSALTELIESEPRLDLVGLAEKAGEAVELVRAEPPDVVLLDLVMPGGGEDAARAIKQIAPETRIVVLTAQDDKATRRALVAVGVSRFLVKGTKGTAILDAVLEVQ